MLFLYDKYQVPCQNPFYLEILPVRILHLILKHFGYDNVPVLEFQNWNSNMKNRVFPTHQNFYFSSENYFYFSFLYYIDLLQVCCPRLKYWRSLDWSWKIFFAWQCIIFFVCLLICYTSQDQVCFNHLHLQICLFYYQNWPQRYDSLSYLARMSRDPVFLYHSSSYLCTRCEKKVIYLLFSSIHIKLFLCIFQFLIFDYLNAIKYSYHVSNCQF